MLFTSGNMYADNLCLLSRDRWEKRAGRDLRFCPQLLFRERWEKQPEHFPGKDETENITMTYNCDGTKVFFEDFALVIEGRRHAAGETNGRTFVCDYKENLFFGLWGPGLSGDSVDAVPFWLCSGISPVRVGAVQRGGRDFGSISGCAVCGAAGGCFLGGLPFPEGSGQILRSGEGTGKGGKPVPFDLSFRHAVSSGAFTLFLSERAVFAGSFVFAGIA